MVVFSLMNHNKSVAPAAIVRATTISAALRPSTETEDDDGDSDGSFFDMDFSVPDDDGAARLSNESAKSSAVSDDLFFKGRLLPDSPFFAASEHRSNSSKPSAKLRVLMRGFNRPKSPVSQKYHSSFFGKKPKIHESPPISLLSNSSCGSGRSVNSSPPPSASGRRFSKDALINRYLSKIKPLYVRVSKLRPAGQKSSPADCSGSKPQKPGNNINLPSGLKVVCRRLGKSRSASAAVVAIPSPTQAIPRRRDDTLLEQQDGIQSAILHCKRSFNAARGNGCGFGSDPLVRSRSDPGEDRSVS